MLGLLDKQSDFAMLDQAELCFPPRALLLVSNGINFSKDRFEPEAPYEFTVKFPSSILRRRATLSRFQSIRHSGINPSTKETDPLHRPSTIAGHRPAFQPPKDL